MSAGFEGKAILFRHVQNRWLWVRCVRYLFARKSWCLVLL